MMNLSHSFSLHRSLIKELWSCGLLVKYREGICYFFLADWTLILMEAIHCRGFIDKQVIMIRFSKSIAMNKLIFILDALMVIQFEQTILPRAP